MILVDTSVLIDYLNGTENAAVEKFHQVIADNVPFGINVFIYQEILQGASAPPDFRRLKKHLDTQTFYELLQGRESYAEAAKIYFDCHRAGYTISGMIDCLVAQTALENDVFLLHNDQDYDRIAEVRKRLKVY